MRQGVLFIVSAPSGAGKTTLCRMAVDFFPELKHSVSYTTRPPRKNEADGIDYHFITDRVFDRMVKNGEFLEWAEVHGFRYGTSGKDIDCEIKNGHNIILDIDVKGAKQIRDAGRKTTEGATASAVPHTPIFIFILPPSMKVCKERLENRGKDDKGNIKKRLENAKAEIKESVWYDYIVINDDLAAAFDNLKSIIIAEKSKKEKMLPFVKRYLSR